MRKVVLLYLVLSILLNVFLICGLINTAQRIIRSEKKIIQLTNLKKHFYDFRERVYKGIPLDFLSHVTLDDFNFDKYEEE